VERVEKFAEKKEWKRAYSEINSFEKLLTDDRYIIEKFWLHINKGEQYRRFMERQNNPLKQWKITEEDWRNRARWDDYLAAAEEMFEKTDRPYAPWRIIPANDKWFARVAVIRYMVHAIERNFKKRGIDLPVYQDQKKKSAKVNQR
jgi:polyphosphate kinase 2 (PPK2 family)